MAQAYVPGVDMDLTFRNAVFKLKDQQAECYDMLYICTEFDRGIYPSTKAQIDYEFSAFPDNNALIGCTEVRKCKGEQVRSARQNP